MESLEHHVEQKVKKRRSHLKKLFITVVAIALIAGTAIATRFALGSADANIASTVSTNAVNVGQQVVVSVMAHSGSQPVNVARARVTYDATKWQFVAADFTGTPFEARTPEPPAHQGSGYYELTGYKLNAPYPSGDFLVGKITLKAVAATTGTGINIDQSNSELYDSVNATKILGSVSGSTVSITDPNQECQNPKNGRGNTKKCRK
jgi:hypothetical protein